LRQILESLDVQSVNTVVDILNYILLCFGQPSHAFDIDKLEACEDQVLSLRYAKEGESFRGLDGKDLTLTSHDCVVSDSKAVHALLGIMGGESSKVDFHSKNIILEFVNPNPVLVRKSSRRHGKQTSSGFAFEKGIDPVFRYFAAALSLSLIKKLTKGTYLGAFHGRTRNDLVSEESSQQEGFLKKGLFLDISVLDYYDLLTTQTESYIQGDKKKHTLKHDINEQSRILGNNYVSYEESYHILDSLGFSPKKLTETVLELSCPHHRLLDIEGDADIVEEVIRVKGIDSVAATPLQTINTVGKDDGHFAFLEKISSLCAKLGYREVLSFHFMKDSDFRNLRFLTQSALGHPIKIMNPINKDESFLQLSLIPDLLRKTAKNIHYSQKGGQLFHLSRTFQNMDASGQKVFHKAQNNSSQEEEFLFEYHSKFALHYSKEKEKLKRPSETPRLAAIAFGIKEEKSWLNKEETLWTLYDLMSQIRDIFKSIDLKAIFTPLEEKHPFKNSLHPKKALSVSCHDGGKNIFVGFVGELHPEVLRNYDISLSSYAFEINLALLFNISRTKTRNFVNYENLQSFPTVEKDFAFILNEEILASSVTTGIENALSEEFRSKNTQVKIHDIFVFDIFRGEGIPLGMKSFALKVRIEPLEKTFTDEEIKSFSLTLVSYMATAFKAVLREG
jgi:phenylalanyl-tRNA synthetase beta chain